MYPIFYLLKGDYTSNTPVSTRTARRNPRHEHFWVEGLQAKRVKGFWSKVTMPKF